jgi:hypothetical protein
MDSRNKAIKMLIRDLQEKYYKGIWKNITYYSNTLQGQGITSFLWG